MPESAQARRIGFLLLPEFSMMAFFAAVEPLRIANRLAEERRYEWSLYSGSGEPVAASNGMTLVVDAAVGEQAFAPTVFVCSGFNHVQYTSAAILRWLRQLSGQGVTLGGIDTGAFVLARAGLLDGRRATVHWESIPAFRELHPQITATTALYEIDGDRITCSGGTATMDLMLEIIGHDHGQELATAVSEQLIVQRVRNPSDHQRMNVPARLGIHNPTLVCAIDVMAGNIEQPLAVSAIARRCGASPRQLERLFATHLGIGPNAYYLRVRLAYARELLHDTDRSVLQVALATGFGSTSSLSRAYRRRYGVPPSRDRRWAI